jgi:restriction endonuclease Mrr
MRWSALVALDETPGPDAVLDVLDRVCARLSLSEEQRSMLSSDGSAPLVLERLVQALGDLWSAGAVEMTESGEVALTDEGSRMTENEVVVLPSAPEDDEDVSSPKQSSPTLRHFLRAFFDSI